MRTHTGDKFNCNQCQSSFVTQQGLKIHQLTIHERGGRFGERPYKCNQCQATYTQRSCLNYHLRKKHQSE